MRSIVIGKFYPPHLGHKYLIDHALAHSDQVTVLICDSPAYAIPATVRQQWLQAIHPDATVRIIPDLDDDDNSARWATHTLKFLGYTPDAVFSSEAYGRTYAQYMKTTHHMVNQKRTHVPICATRVRADVLHEWEYLHPIVKADLAKRIVVVGAESTGTSTLSQDLAQKLHAAWAPEYGRLYSQGVAAANWQWTDDDFVAIATSQQNLERQMARGSNGIIICDTNATATEVWQKHYVGQTSADVHAIASNDIVDLYIITDDDIPFVQDGTRSNKRRRTVMQRDLIVHIEKTGAKYVIVNGTRKQRTDQALEHINALSFTRKASNPHNIL